MKMMKYLVAMISVGLACYFVYSGDITQVAGWGVAEGKRTKALQDLVVTDVPATITALNTLDQLSAMQVQTGTFTNGTATVTFGTVFTAAPKVVCNWNTDLSGAGVLTNTALCATSVTPSNFVPKAALPVYGYTNCTYIAVYQPN